MPNDKAFMRKFISFETKIVFVRFDFERKVSVEAKIRWSDVFSIKALANSSG